MSDVKAAWARRSPSSLVHLVDVARIERAILVAGNFLHIAVDADGGTMNHPFGPLFSCRIQDVLGAAHIDVIIFLVRMVGGAEQRRHMVDPLGAFCGLGHIRSLGQITLHHPGAGIAKSRRPLCGTDQDRQNRRPGPTGARPAGRRCSRWHRSPKPVHPGGMGWRFRYLTLSTSALSDKAIAPANLGLWVTGSRDLPGANRHLNAGPAAGRRNSRPKASE